VYCVWQVVKTQTIILNNPVYIIIFSTLQVYNCVCSVRLQPIFYVQKFTLLAFISNFAEVSHTAKTVRQAWSSRCNYQPTIWQLLVILLYRYWRAVPEDTLLGINNKEHWTVIDILSILDPKNGMQFVNILSKLYYISFRLLMYYINYYIIDSVLYYFILRLNTSWKISN
jgi:hypothetical protein